MGLAQVRRSKAATIFMGVILLLLGLIFCFAPGFTMQFIGWIVGIAFLIAGAVSLINFFMYKDTQNFSDALLGAICVILGIVLFCIPEAAVNLAMVVIGVFVFITGILDISDAIQANKMGASRWGLFLAFGIITAIFGFLVIIAPWAFATVFFVICGVALIFDGITEILVGVSL